MGVNLWLPGDTWSAPRDNLAKPQGVIAQGARTTTKTVTGSEVGVMRLDNLGLLAGRSYLMQAQNLRISVTGTLPDHYALRLRYSGAGAATTASNEIGRYELSISGAGQFDTAGPVVGIVNPGTDVSTASVILTVIRTSGTGTTPTFQADPGGVWLSVFDMGIAVPDSAVII